MRVRTVLASCCAVTHAQTLSSSFFNPLTAESVPDTTNTPENTYSSSSSSSTSPLPSLLSSLLATLTSDNSAYISASSANPGSVASSRFTNLLSQYSSLASAISVESQPGSTITQSAAPSSIMTIASSSSSIVSIDTSQTSQPSSSQTARTSSAIAADQHHKARPLSGLIPVLAALLLQ